MRGNENEQFLQFIGAAFAFKQITQPGNILQKRCAGLNAALRFLAQTADNDGLPVILNDIGFGFFGDDRGIAEHGPGKISLFFFYFYIQF